MLNHAFALLAQLPGPRLPDPRTPASVYLPKFTPLPLPDYLASVWRQLYGSSPDPAMRFYRTRQLLSVLHATPLAEYVFALDPRISYPLGGDDLVDETPFLPRVAQLSGVESLLEISGRPQPPDLRGIMRQAFTLTVEAGSLVVTSQQGLGGSQTTPLGSPAALGDTGYTATTIVSDTGVSWNVELYNRPQLDLSQLLVRIGRLNEATLLALFGFEQHEPYLSCRNLWQLQDEVPLTLAAITLLLIYRIQGQRSG